MSAYFDSNHSHKGIGSDKSKQLEYSDLLNSPTIYTPDEATIVSDENNIIEAQYLYSGLAIYQDQKAAGVNGGTFTAGAWRTRTLNTEVYDSIGITLSSNQVTIPAGTYHITASAPFIATGNTQAILYNISDSSVSLYSNGIYSVTNVESRNIISGVVTIVSSKIFEIRQQCNVTNATFGFGASAPFGIASFFTTLEIKKIRT